MTVLLFFSGLKNYGLNYSNDFLKLYFHKMSVSMLAFMCRIDSVVVDFSCMDKN